MGNARQEKPMYKVINLIKRKPHLTHEQFRAHFERSHAPMAQKFCGHLFSDYRRHYIDQALFGGDPRVEGSGFGPREWDWDLISEWTTPDEESYNKIIEIMESSEVKHLFEEDEDRFIHRKTIVMATCTASFNTGTTLSDPKGTVFDTPTGEPTWDWAQYDEEKV
jgi:hypothetical protein